MIKIFSIASKATQLLPIPLEGEGRQQVALGKKGRGPTKMVLGPVRGSPVSYLSVDRSTCSC